MSHRRAHPLRALSAAEHEELEQLSRSNSCPAEWVRRAKLILLVEEGQDYLVAARQMGRRNGDGVSALVERFNTEGLSALVPKHGGGPALKYGRAERDRIVQEVARTPERNKDGTATWSLTTLQRALRTAPDGLPTVSRDTIRTVLLEAGYSWQHSRTWCKTGQVIRQRKTGTVVVEDEDSDAKKN
jgi:transposase